MNKKRDIFLLILLTGLFLVINYNFIDSNIENFLEEYEFGIVERVVDGDTAIVNGNSTRLLGVNTPERGEKYYQEAKNFLENLTLNKTAKLEYGKERYDLYKRKLTYLFLEEKNINVELVKNGFANIYILDDKLHEGELKKAWSECIERGKNLCEKSKDKCAQCIELAELDYKNQEVVLYNICSFDCDLDSWTIKDEGRKKFTFKNFVLKEKKEIKIVVGEGADSENVLFWKGNEYVWTETGDTLFLRDKEGRLVLWENY